MHTKTIINIDGRKYYSHSGEPVEGSVRPLSSHDSTYKKRDIAPHVKAHPQSRSVILMRRGVGSPPAHLSHRLSKLRVQGPIPSSNTIYDISPDTPEYMQRRLNLAQHSHKSTSISHFNKNGINHYELRQETSVAAPGHVPTHSVLVAQGTRPVAHPKTSAELVEIALRSARAHEAQPLPKHGAYRAHKLRHKLLRKRKTPAKSIH